MPLLRMAIYTRGGERYCARTVPLAVFNPWYRDPYNRVTVTPEMTLRYEAEARDLQQRYGVDNAQVFWWDQRNTEHRELVYQFYPSEPEKAFLSSGRPVFDLKNL